MEDVQTELGTALGVNERNRIAELTMKGIERSMRSRDDISPEITPTCTVSVNPKGLKLQQEEDLGMKLFNGTFTGKFHVTKGRKEVTSGAFESQLTYKSPTRENPEAENIYEVTAKI